MDPRSNQSSPFTGFTSRKGGSSSAPGYDAQPQSAPLNMSAFQQQQGVQTPFGSLPNLQAFQNQQDAFVQQFLQNQAQYNQGLMGGQRPEPVDLGATWGQAANNIRDGLYQGNPFATGNVDALMGMFGQYGITPPQGFQDQLINQLGQQSAPPMYGTGMPSSQPMTGFPTGPGGEYWPGMRMPQQPTPPAAATPPAPPPPERAPWSPPPPPPGGWRSEQQRRDAEHQSRVQYMMNPGMNQDASPVRQPVVAEPEPAPRQPVTPRMPVMGLIGAGRMPDWGFPVDTESGGPAMDTPPAAQPNPSAPWSSNDPWSYPLLPGMRRGPSGEQIMTEEARQAEIRRREQETGMRYVKPRAPGQTGSWLPAPKPASQKKDQSAAMAEYIRTQATPGRARPTPTRTQGTRRR